MGKKIGSLLVIAVLGFCIRFAWNIISYDATDEPITAAEERAEQAEWMADDDAWMDEQLSAGTAEEARGWLDHPKHGTFEAHPQQMRDAISAFDEAGATDIWIVDPAMIGGGALADGFTVRLPADGPDRDAIFAAEAALWGGEGTPDLGQRYLSVSFD